MRLAPRLFVLAAVLCLVGSVQAQSINWTFVQGGFANWDPDFRSSENGWFVGGSVALGKVPVHIYGQYGDFGDPNIWQAGGGWHGLLGKRADLFADGAIYDNDYDDGWVIRFGARWMVLKRVEINGFFSWTDLDLTDNEAFAANAIFDLTKRIGVGGGFNWGDNWSTARVLVRFNFGPRG